MILRMPLLDIEEIKKKGIRTIITVRKGGQKNDIGLGEVDYV